MSGAVRVRITTGTGVTATQNVYQITGSGARGPAGPPPVLNTLPDEPVILDTDIGLLEETDGTQKKFTFANLWVWVKAKADLIYAFIINRDDHGTVSTGSEELSATSTHHTLTTAGSHTWTFADFTESRPEISLKLTVSSGTPTITIPAAATIASDSAQTLSAMAAGTYWVSIASFDDGTTYEIFVGLVV